MELDDLRGQWQAQPVTTDNAIVTVSSAQPGLIEKMRQNAWWELGLTTLLALGTPFFIALSESPANRLWGAGMLLLLFIMLFYYYQKLALLKRMARNDGGVHGHLETLYEGLRTLLRFYYRLTLATGPIIFVLWLSYQVAQELARPEAFRWGRFGLMTLFMLVFGALMQVGAVYGTRWYLQRLYGQHLDRLEATLRELRD